MLENKNMPNSQINKRFWEQQANKFLSWFNSWDEVLSGDWSKGNTKWFTNAKLNASYNCIDKHLPEKADATAFIWEGNEPHHNSSLSYQQLHDEVCKLANALKKVGTKKGDKVCIYLPMIPEAIISMLACARIGAVHTVVFAGFSHEALLERITDAKACLLISCDTYVRGDKLINLKQNVDIALEQITTVEKVVVVNLEKYNHINNKVNWVAGRDISYKDFIKEQQTQCKPEIMDAEDPLFILYTSGSTGKPKGVVHTTAGYLLQSAMSFSNIFEYKSKDVYFCAADIGWITGHTYIVYGPLLNAATSIIFSGTPIYPDASRIWKMVDKYRISILYTSPTALRMLMAKGDKFLEESSSRHSLRILGSVGEPLNPDVWYWYHNKVGNKKCKIVDTWWQTETGSIIIKPTKKNQIPGSVGKSDENIPVLLLDDDGNVIIGQGSGALVVSCPWPSQLRTLNGNHELFLNIYLRRYPGYFFTGDEAYRDNEGNIWITGRIDDVMNISGHRLGSAEIENSLVAHPKVAEAAAIGAKHAIKGESITTFVILIDGFQESRELIKELKQKVVDKLGSFACPDRIFFVMDLPKTRSGKIMRRILRQITNGNTEQLGDISTLANPEVIKPLIYKIHSTNHDIN